MVSVSSIRESLRTKVFDNFGKSVVLNSYSSPTYNNRGEIVAQSETTETITLVPYNVVSDRQTYQKWGNVSEGEFDAAVPYDVSISTNNTIIMDGDTYDVKNVEENPLPDNVVTIIRLVKQQD